MSLRGSSAASSSNWPHSRLAIGSSTSEPSTMMRWCSSRAATWSSIDPDGSPATLVASCGLMTTTMRPESVAHQRNLLSAEVPYGAGYSVMYTGTPTLEVSAASPTPLTTWSIVPALRLTVMMWCSFTPGRLGTSNPFSVWIDG